jgi:hypothetical protein
MDHTLAYSLVLINAVPKRSGLVKHPDVPMHSLPTEPRQPSSEEEDWWLRLVKSEAHSCEQACPILRGGFLTIANSFILYDNLRSVLLYYQLPC